MQEWEKVAEIGISLHGDVIYKLIGVVSNCFVY